jgi:hypothetical protein
MDSPIENSYVTNSNASVKIRSAGLEILQSGSVHAFDSTPLEFTLFSSLKLTLIFLVRPGAQQSIEPETLSDSEVRFKMINFDNNMGSGPTSPIELGKFMGRKLSMVFVVQKLGTSLLSTVHYSFLLAPIEQEQKQKSKK